jgi:hypothetical protein
MSHSKALLLWGVKLATWIWEACRRSLGRSTWHAGWGFNLPEGTLHMNATSARTIHPLLATLTLITLFCSGCAHWYTPYYYARDIRRPPPMPSGWSCENGNCHGYRSTQWRSWEEACGIAALQEPQWQEPATEETLPESLVDRADEALPMEEPLPAPAARPESVPLEPSSRMPDSPARPRMSRETQQRLRR